MHFSDDGSAEVKLENIRGDLDLENVNENELPQYFRNVLDNRIDRQTNKGHRSYEVVKAKVDKYGNYSYSTSSSSSYIY